MTYERLDEALERLRQIREARKAAEERKRLAAAAAAAEFARIKAEIIEPVFVEIIVQLAGRGFWGEIGHGADATGPISLVADLSESEGVSQKESLRVIFDQDNALCQFDRAKAHAQDISANVVGDTYRLEEITANLVNQQVEEFIVDLASREIDKAA